MSTSAGASFSGTEEWERFLGLAEVAAGKSTTAFGQPDRRESATPSEASAEARAFDRLVELKVETSRIAMHLETAWRSGLFRQLDGLLDVENWETSDTLPTTASYLTFLRLLVLLGKPRRPGLGATDSGNIIASWTVAENRLTIECQPGDRVRWIIVRFLEGGKISTAGRSASTQLVELL